MSEERLVPKLRFSGFNDEWSINKLDEISSLTSSKRIYSSDYVETGIPFYRGAEITQLKNNEEIKEKLFISTEKYNELKNKFGAPKKDDILVTGVGTLGNVYKIRDNAEFYFKDGNLIWIKDITINPDFLELYLETFKNEMLKLAIGSTQKALTIVSLEKLKVKYPNIQEQRKIANFFEVLDNKIRLLSEKYNYYIDFKKYLMQQIFAQKLRFNDNNNEPYENWEGLQLKDIISLQGGYAFKSELFKDEGVPIIRISNISPNNSVILDDLVYYDKLDNDSDFIIKKGELIIAMSGATTGKVGVYDLDQIAYINQRVGLFKQISNELYYPFLIQYTLSDTFKRELQKTLVAGAQPNISKKEIESFKINLPQYGEQKKIADLLFNIDLKINTVKNQSTEISQFKKGLLQQMFV